MELEQYLETLEENEPLTGVELGLDLHDLQFVEIDGLTTEVD